MQSPAATAEKLPDSLTFLPYLLSDGPLRRPEADLRVGAVAERLCRRTPTAAQRYGLPLSGEPVALGIDDDHRVLHQVRSVVEGSDRLPVRPQSSSLYSSSCDYGLRSLSALAIESLPSSLFVGRSLGCRMFGERVGGVQVCPVGHPHAQPFDQLAAEPARHHRQTRPSRERIIGMMPGSPGTSIRNSQLAANSTTILTLNSACTTPTEWARVPSGTREKSIAPNTIAANPPSTPAAIIQKAISDHLPLPVSR